MEQKHPLPEKGEAKRETQMIAHAGRTGRTWQDVKTRQKQNRNKTG
jgi:hypothetical protein